MGATDLPLSEKFARFRGRGAAGGGGGGGDGGRERGTASPIVLPPPRSGNNSGGGALGQILSESSSSLRRGSLRRSVIADGGGGGKELLYPFSNTGPCVTLFAPGSDLLAACGGSSGRGRRCPDPALPHAMAWSSGTSMAAPLVAGAAALILGERPWASPAEVKAELVSRATEGALEFDSKKPEVLAGTPNKLLYLGPL